MRFEVYLDASPPPGRICYTMQMADDESDRQA